MGEKGRQIEAAVRACESRNHVTHCNEFKVRYLSFRGESSKESRLHDGSAAGETYNRRRLYTVPSTSLGDGCSVIASRPLSAQPSMYYKSRKYEGCIVDVKGGEDEAKGREDEGKEGERKEGERKEGEARACY